MSAEPITVAQPVVQLTRTEMPPHLWEISDSDRGCGPGNIRPACFDACAQARPPLTVAGDFVISDELQASDATTIDRPDGSKQLVMGKWSLYYYAGDGAPGEANGQGSKDKW